MKHRHELAYRIPPNGTAVELGVAAGDFSDLLLRTAPGFFLLSVDKWNDHHDNAERDAALALLSKHGKRSRVVQATFEVALRLIPDATFDLIYIDGYAHTGQDGGKTLDQWWPKLKPGGTFAGHDYHPEWPETVQAVHRFVSKIGRSFNDFGLTVDDAYPSWWLVK